MSELDGFERSLETALRAFADRGAAPVDAVDFAELVAQRPRRRAWLAGPRLPGRLAPVRATIWFLLMLGLLLALVIGGLAGSRRQTPALVIVPSPASATATATARASALATSAPLGTMTRPRTCHTATPLRDGRVLLVGGDMGNHPNESTAELFDPVTGVFTPAGLLKSEDLACHAAIPLADGRIVVYGGADSFSSHWPEIWDPATGAFTPVGDVLATDDSLAAGPLPDGRILIILPRGATVELLDPITGAYSATGGLAEGRHFESATTLRDGRVLVAGGEPAADDAPRLGPWPTAIEVYDPALGAFVTAGRLAAGRAGHTAIVLADGRVLIVGGYSDRVGSGTPDTSVPLRTAEIWDPATGTARATGSMGTPRIAPTATLLADGRVLVTGGGSDREVPVASAEIWDPATGTFSPTGSMAAARKGHAASRLPDGTVLISGGTPSSGGWLGDTARYLASAERYDPNTGTFGPVGRR